MPYTNGNVMNVTERLNAHRVYLWWLLFYWFVANWLWYERECVVDALQSFHKLSQLRAVNCENVAVATFIVVFSILLCLVLPFYCYCYTGYELKNVIKWNMKSLNTEDKKREKNDISNDNQSLSTWKTTAAQNKTAAIDWSLFWCCGIAIDICISKKISCGDATQSV